MSSEQPEAPAGVLTSLAALVDDLQVTELTRLDDRSLVALLDRFEVQSRRLPAVRNRLVAAIDTRIIDSFVDVLPSRLPAAVRDKAETDLVDFAADYGPVKLSRVGQRIIDFLDPDGTLRDEEEAHRRRGVVIGPLRHGLRTDQWLPRCAHPRGPPHRPRVTRRSRRQAGW